MADNKAELVLDGNIAPLKQKLREAGDELNRFGASGGPAIDGVASSVMKLTSRFTALGAVLSLGGLATLSRQSIDAADHLNDLALQTQSSVKALASFHLISEQSGTDLGALGKGLNKLSIWMAENAEAAKKLGITARDPVQAFIQFTEVLERAKTPQDRAGIANKVLGKSFAELLPLLSEGSKNLREAAAASEEYAQKLEKLAPRADTFNDRLAEMKLRWDALKVSMGSAFLDLMPNSMTMDKASARIIQLKGDIGSLQRALEGSDGAGLLHKLMYGTKDEITAKLAAARSELAALQAQKAAAPSGTGGGPLTIADFEPPKKTKTPKAKTGDQVSDAEWAMEEAAHLQRTLYEIDQERNEYHEAANKAVVEADKKLVKEMDEIQLLRVEGAKNAELARIDEMQASAQHELEMGTLTQAEYLSRLAQFNQERLAAEQMFIAQKRDVALEDPEQNPGKLEQLEQEKAEVRRRYRQQDLEIQRQQAVESESIWRSLGDSISGLWDKGMQALLNGTLTWRNAMQAIGAEVVRWFATQVVGAMVKEWIAGQMKKLAALLGFTTAEKTVQVASTAATVATKTAETTAVVGANAAQAGSGAAASQASIPYVGPILALAAMAAVFAAVMAMGKKKSAAGGYDIPKGVNPMTQLHEEEMVLPKHLANTVRAMAAGGAGEGAASAVQPVNVNITSHNARGVRELFMDNPDILAEAIRKAVRNGFK